MADRCDHCSVRMDGLEVHADFCPVRGPEIAAENEKLREDRDHWHKEAHDLLKRYEDGHRSFLMLRAERDKLFRENQAMRNALETAVREFGSFGSMSDDDLAAMMKEALCEKQSTECRHLTFEPGGICAQCRKAV